MPALTVANVAAALVLSFVAGIGWTTGCWLVGRALK
jgi:hypothetical protein